MTGARRPEPDARIADYADNVIAGTAGAGYDYCRRRQPLRQHRQRHDFLITLREPRLITVTRAGPFEIYTGDADPALHVACHAGLGMSAGRRSRAPLPRRTRENVVLGAATPGQPRLPATPTTSAAPPRPRRSPRPSSLFTIDLPGQRVYHGHRASTPCTVQDLRRRHERGHWPLAHLRHTVVLGTATGQPPAPAVRTTSAATDTGDLDITLSAIYVTSCSPRSRPLHEQRIEPCTAEATGIG